MKSKGQLTIEFTLILVILILFIVTYIQPHIIVAENYSKETFALGYVSLAANKIANTVDLIQASGGEAVQTITVFVPDEGLIVCNGEDSMPLEDQNSIRFQYTLISGTPHSACPGDLCDKLVRPRSGAGIKCGAGFISIDGPSLINLKISKLSENQAEPVIIESA